MPLTSSVSFTILCIVIGMHVLMINAREREREGGERRGGEGVTKQRKTLILF